MVSGGGRTDRTPYIIYALAALQAAIGTYVGTRSDTQEAVQKVADRVTAMEAGAPIRREMRDREFRALSERIERLETPRR